MAPETRSGAPRRDEDKAAQVELLWYQRARFVHWAIGILIVLVAGIAGGAITGWRYFDELRAESGNARVMAGTAVNEVKLVRDTVRALRDTLTIKINWAVALGEAQAKMGCKRDPTTMREAGIRCSELEIPRELMRRP